MKVGSGITSRSAQIRSRSSRKEFDITPVGVFLHHFPEGALRLVGLRGVHLAEVEGDAEHDIATQNQPAVLKSGLL